MLGDRGGAKVLEDGYQWGREIPGSGLGCVGFGLRLYTTHSYGVFAARSLLLQYSLPLPRKKQHRSQLDAKKLRRIISYKDKPTEGRSDEL